MATMQIFGGPAPTTAPEFKPHPTQQQTVGRKAVQEAPTQLSASAVEQPEAECLQGEAYIASMPPPGVEPMTPKNVHTIGDGGPLWCAASFGMLPELKAAIFARMDVDQSGGNGCWNGTTAICMAGRNRAQDCMEELVKAGANVMRAGMQGKNAIHWAAEQGLQNALAAIFTSESYRADCKVNINVGDSSGNTPLHTAVHNGDIGCVKVILDEWLVDLTKTNAAGKTALQMAEEANKANIVALLQKPPFPVEYMPLLEVRAFKAYLKDQEVEDYENDFSILDDTSLQVLRAAVAKSGRKGVKLTRMNKLLDEMWAKCGIPGGAAKPASGAFGKGGGFDSSPGGGFAFGAVAKPAAASVRVEGAGSAECNGLYEKRAELPSISNAANDLQARRNLGGKSVVRV